MDINVKRFLHFNYIEFNNRTLAANWYNGRQYINELRFQNCLIETIEANAFDVSAFHNIRLIRIDSNIGAITFQTGCFNGLKRMEKLLLNNLTLIHTDSGSGILSDSCKSLNELRLLAINANVGLEYFFKSHRYTNFEIIVVEHSNSNKFQTLAPANFSNILVLRALKIEGGDLRVILAGTFDVVAKSLRNLLLIDTKLIAFTATIFQAYFEYSHSFISGITIIVGNTYECNCDYYLFRNVMMIRRASFKYVGYVLCSNEQSIDHCPDFQQLGSHHLCYQTSISHQLYTYTRFEVNLENDRDSIVVRTNASGRFKIIIQLNDLPLKAYCPRHIWLQENIKCFYLDKNRTEISKSMFNHSQLLRISFIYFIYGWPLSFATIRTTDDYDGNNQWAKILIVVIVPICFGMCFGCCIVAIWKRDKETEPIDNP